MRPWSMWPLGSWHNLIFWRYPLIYSHIHSYPLTSTSHPPHIHSHPLTSTHINSYPLTSTHILSYPLVACSPTLNFTYFHIISTILHIMHPKRKRHRAQGSNMREDFCVHRSVPEAIPGTDRNCPRGVPEVSKVDPKKSENWRAVTSGFLHIYGVSGMWPPASKKHPWQHPKPSPWWWKRDPVVLWHWGGKEFFMCDHVEFDRQLYI